MRVSLGRETRPWSSSETRPRPHFSSAAVIAKVGRCLKKGARDDEGGPRAVLPARTRLFHVSEDPQASVLLQIYQINTNANASDICFILLHVSFLPPLTMLSYNCADDFSRLQWGILRGSTGTSRCRCGHCSGHAASSGCTAAARPGSGVLAKAHVHHTLSGSGSR